MRSTQLYRQLFLDIAASKEGNILEANIRFNRFIPENIKYSTWERILGADVNNLRHMWFTKRLTQHFLNASPKNQFTKRDRHLLLLTATFHDLAESVVGDIQKIDKTIADDQHEQQVMKILIAKFSKKYQSFNQLQSDLLYATDYILFPKKPNKLSRAFSNIEYLGYLHTACKAANAVLIRTHKTPLYHRLDDLAKEVIENSLQNLHPQMKKFPAISIVLKTRAPYTDQLSPRHLRPKHNQPTLNA